MYKRQVYGQAVTFTATVTNPLATATPAGPLHFTVDSQVAATRTLDASGVAVVPGRETGAGGQGGDVEPQHVRDRLEAVDLSLIHI